MAEALIGILFRKPRPLKMAPIVLGVTLGLSPDA